jgi:hypothetical protein
VRDLEGSNNKQADLISMLNKEIHNLRNPMEMSSGNLEDLSKLNISNFLLNEREGRLG